MWVHTAGYVTAGGVVDKEGDSDQVLEGMIHMESLTKTYEHHRHFFADPFPPRKSPGGYCVSLKEIFQTFCRQGK